MKRFLLFLACVLFCFGMFASGARAQAVPCCSITAIDAQTGIVSAKVNSTSAVFQFKVTDAETLQSLRVGQGVYANFTTNQVSLDGKKTCCSITNRPQAPVAAPITRPVSPSANGPATSQPSRPQAPVAAPLPRPVLPPSTRGPAASQPSPTLRNQANAVQILKKVASPVNVRTTQSLDECRTYANGNSIGCATAMQGSYYIVIWDWNGADGDIDGFNVYQGGATTPSSSRGPVTPFAGGNTAPSSVRGPVTQLVQQPIQTISQHPLLRVAVFDPKQLGTNACFTVTAYSGVTESARSSQTCVTPANASTAVFKSVALVPNEELVFFGYHAERTNHVYCSSNFGPNSAPSGTGVWTLSWNSNKTPPYPTDYGVVMSLAEWDAGHEPFPCQELYMQVLRLGVTFQFPPDLAQVQSVTLVTNLQSVEIGGVNLNLSDPNSENGYIPCVWSVYSMQYGVGGSETGNLPLTTFNDPRPFVWEDWYPGLTGGQPSGWIYPATDGLPGNGQKVLPPVGEFGWPPKNGVYSADVTAVAKQHPEGIALMMKTDDDQIGSLDVVQPYSTDNSYYNHQGKAVCQYKFNQIRLQLNYIAKTSP